MPTEFVDELPPTGSSWKGVGDRVLAAFAKDLQANPGRWAKYPKPVSGQSVRSLGQKINNVAATCPIAFRGGQFEAATRNGTLYVRFNPEAAS